jgi:DNA-binding NarL/FixJ family response regulator
MSIRVAIYEDNQNLRESLFQLIDGTDGFRCVGAFANCEFMLRQIEDTKPDVVLMDIELPGISGIEAVKILKERFPEVKVLMETIFEEDDKIFNSICNGAEGYILKNTPPAIILASIKDIYEGGAPMTPSVASKVLKMFKKNSMDTVSGHIKNIYKKLQVHSKSEAVVKAIKGKMI